MQTPTCLVRRWAAACLAAVFAPLGLAAEPVAEPLSRPALMTRLAPQSVLMKIARAGNRLVAVGERGIVILSDDGGRRWRQAEVPVSVTLTGVHFPTEKQGWAVGHYGVVLHSEDGGETWVRQLDGNAAAELYREAAQAEAGEMEADDPVAERLLADAERMVADGPDKPFFDLHFDDGQRGFVVGAYNLIFRTEDGGRTWRCLSHQMDNPRAFHLYGIEVKGGAIYLAGEQGLFLRSLDGGQRFARLPTPYEGSFFRLAVLPAGEVVLAGLRGNAWRSADQGESWEKVEAGAPISFTAATVAGGDTLLLANQAGQVFESRDHGRSLAPRMAPTLPPVTDLAALPDGSLLATSIRGAIRIEPAASAVGEEKTR